GPYRGAHLRGVSRVLRARHAASSAQGARARSYGAPSNGEARAYAAARRSVPDHRRARAPVHPLHRARTRSAAAAAEARVDAAAASAPEDRPAENIGGDVVQTFDPSFLENQAVTYAHLPQLRKSGQGRERAQVARALVLRGAPLELRLGGAHDGGVAGVVAESDARGEIGELGVGVRRTGREAAERRAE